MLQPLLGRSKFLLKGEENQYLRLRPLQTALIQSSLDLRHLPRQLPRGITSSLTAEWVWPLQEVVVYGNPFLLLFAP